MGEAGRSAEVSATEMGDLRWFPIAELVAAGHRFDHPGIDGKCGEMTTAEEEHAVGDFLANSGQREEPRFGGGVRECAGFFEPAGTGTQKFCGAEDVAGAEAELAGPKLFFGGRGELIPSGQVIAESRDFCSD